MNFIDLCSGIGGFRLGMEAAGHKCVGFAEIDAFPRTSYKAIHDTEGEWERHDVTKISDEEWRELRGSVDIVCAGFPCQSFSVAGKRMGFDETRGTIFFEIARAIKQIQPSVVLLENVLGLLSHDSGRTFRTILNTLDELGYDVEWRVFNSKYFGVAHNRRRVFVVATPRGRDRRSGELLSEEKTQQLLKNMDLSKYRVQENEIGVLGRINPEGYRNNNEVLDPGGISTTLRTFQGGGLQPKILIPRYVGHLPSPAGINNTLRTGGTGSTSAKHNYEHIAIPCITPDIVNMGQNGRRFKESNDPMFTLTASGKHGVLIPFNIPIKEATELGFAEANAYDSVNLALPNSKTRRGRVGKQVANTLDTGCQQGVVIPFEHFTWRIRRLTPRECWRLQAFPDWAFDRAKAVGVSNSQLYKQAGNSVTASVVEVIAMTF